MKTKIEKIYTPPAGYHIAKVLLADKERVLVFLDCTQHTKHSRIELLKFGEVVRTHDFPVLADYFGRRYSATISTTRDKLIIVFLTGKMVFWGLDSLSEIHFFDITNYPAKDYSQRRSIPEFVTQTDTNSYIIALTGLGHMGSRFLAKTIPDEISNEKFIIKKTIELPKNEYPISKIQQEHAEFPMQEWVHIRDIFCIEGSCYVHTLGWSHPRVLNGIYSDFSLISKFDHELNFICNFNIEDGFGNPSTTRKYFILNPRKKKSRLYFYNTSNFCIDDEVSLTPKQNLGTETNKWIKADLIDDLLLVYNAKFLHFCQLL
jgi:hypothetical protein